jgi:hypothetical protein
MITRGFYALSAMSQEEMSFIFNFSGIIGHLQLPVAASSAARCALCLRYTDSALRLRIKADQATLRIDYNQYSLTS